jgi:hypothetical protein
MGPRGKRRALNIAGALFPVEKGEEQRSVEEALESSSPQREKGDPLGSPLFCFLRLVQVYALEGYWTARVREEFESLVTCEFRFGNEDSGSASQRNGGRERFVLSHPSAQNAEGLMG